MAIIFWRSLRGVNLPAMRAGAQIGFFLFGGYVLQTTGLKFTTPSKAAFLTGSSVVIVPIILAAFGLRRITAWIWAGAIAAVAGLYLLTIPPQGVTGLNRGDPLVFLAAIMFALHIIFVGRQVGTTRSPNLLSSRWQRSPSSVRTQPYFCGCSSRRAQRPCACRCSNHLNQLPIPRMLKLKCRCAGCMVYRTVPSSQCLLPRNVRTAD